MSLAISVVALLISLSSLSLAIYQSKVISRIRRHEKASALARHAADIRRKSTDLKLKANCTDNAPDCEELHERADAMLRLGVEALVGKASTTLENMYEIERGMVTLEVEIDLLYKEVCDVERFNQEVREYEKNAANHSLQARRP